MMTDPNKRIIDVAGRKIMIDLSRTNLEDWLKMMIAALQGDQQLSNLLSLQMVSAVLGSEAKKLSPLEGPFVIAKTLEVLQEMFTGFSLESEIEEIINRNKPE
jgi:hypothetical protein